MKTRMIAMLSLLAALWCAGCDEVFNDAMDDMAIWQKSWYTFLGGSGQDSANSVQKTADGGYIIAGSGYAFTDLQGKTPLNGCAGNRDILLVKLDASGSVDWCTFIGGADDAEIAYSVQQTADGGYIVAGIAYADIPTLQTKSPIIAYSHVYDQYNNLVVKLDASGSVAWYTFLGETNFAAYDSVQQTTDGGYIVAGAAAGNIPTLQGKTPINAYSTNYNTLVVKLDASGNVAWFTFLGETPSNVAIFVQRTADGGSIVTGLAAADISAQLGKTPINPYSGSQDILVVKLNASGSIAWCTFLGGTGLESASSIQQTSDDGFIIAGAAYDNIPYLQEKTPINAYDSSADMLVVKLNASGSVAWYTFLGGTGLESASSIQQTADGGYIVAGVEWGYNIPTLQGKTPLYDFTENASGPLSSIDMLVVKLDASGSVDWYTFLGGTGVDGANSVQQTADGGYVVVGSAAEDINPLQGKTPVNDFSGSGDMLVVKLKNDGTL
jgi:hypothetical protein